MPEQIEGGAGAGSAAATQTTAAAGQAGQQGAAGSQQQQEELVPKSEAQKAFRSRDEAKTAVRLLASTFGLDPAEIRVVANPDDKDNPFKLEGDGLEEAATLMQQARTSAQQQRKSRQSWDDREKELTGKLQKDLQGRAAAWDQERGGLTQLLREQLTTPALRAAFAAEGAFDHDGSGSFEDLIALTKGRVKVDIQRDEHGGYRTDVTPLKEDGTPLLDGSGKPATVRQLASDFLSKRPHFKDGRFRRGPGAGGAGAGATSAGGRPQDPTAGAHRAADMLFGARPQHQQQQR